MSSSVAPWLAGLSDGWEEPQHVAAKEAISSASHNAASLRGSTGRIPRRSLSGLPSSLSSQRKSSTRRPREPLASLSTNDANSTHRRVASTILSNSSLRTDGLDVFNSAAGTVQQRSKSASPAKQQDTMEWKRRLVRGQVGYGDQTDLFGPSGLENIFAQSKGDGTHDAKPTKRPTWLTKAGPSMPSSPPPWPSSFAQQLLKESRAGNLSTAREEQDHQDSGEISEEAVSFNSNPFNLESHDNDQRHEQQDASSLQQPAHIAGKITDTTQQEQGCPNDRAVCGPTELEQEDFSPVFVSKHTTARGQVDYAAFDSHLVKQFESMKVDVRRTNPAQQEEVLQESSELPAHPKHDQDESRMTIPDISFSENLPTGSPMPNLSQNVEFRRGGYSQYDSFKTRPLSPSPPTITDAHAPSASTDQLVRAWREHERLIASTNTRDPSTPTREKDEPKSRSSGSPLKLFDTHDTYTSNRLMRRLSQLNLDGTVVSRCEAPLPEADEHANAVRKISAGSSFGAGELDSHSFNAQITITSASDSSKDDGDRSPGSEVMVPGSIFPFDFERGTRLDLQDPFASVRSPNEQDRSLTRSSSTYVDVALARPTPTGDTQEARDFTVSIQQQIKSTADGKRPPSSPSKYPTPKRRRTLHASELQECVFAPDTPVANAYGDAVSSRKRKDARHGEAQNTADPETLAQRKMLRPRNPTPSQRRRQQIESELKKATEKFVEQEPERLEAVIEQIESSMATNSPPSMRSRAQTLASEVAAFTLKVQKPSSDMGERKRSVTTQDFLDEALMVMDLIRARARPQSNLGSVEESDAEALGRDTSPADESREEYLLRVSRPPSREGSGWRSGASAINNARVMSHLRKFQEREEKDDTDFIVDSDQSLDVDNEQHTNKQVVVIDEQSNIRISGPSPVHPRQHDAQANAQQSQPSTVNTRSTQHSTGESTARTTGSSSTRKSDNVGTLAPDAVAHLIGSEVGGMTFDKDKRRWVRVTKSPQKDHGSFLELPSNVTSDDDPLREISDLPVDEQNELRRISAPFTADAVPTATDTHDTVEDPEVVGTAQQPLEGSRAGSNETVISRPLARSSVCLHDTQSSSAPSRFTARASSQHEKVETRATSWSDEEMKKAGATGHPIQPTSPSTGTHLLSSAEPFSDDLQDHSRSPNDCLLQRLPSRSHVPVPKSSLKLKGSVQEVNVERDQPVLDAQVSDHEELVSPKLRQTPCRSRYAPSSVLRTANRQMSLRRKTLTNCWTAEIHEEGELSFVASLPGDRMMSVSLNVSRPFNQIPPRQVTEWQSSPPKDKSSFILSDLPEFTVHEEDSVRPSEKALAVRMAQHAAAEIDDRYALAVKDLVQALTDTNENDPFWEDLRHLNLHSRSLVSLYGLNDFCTNIQDIDVSDNALTHVCGAPPTIRRLLAGSNRLSSLTAWNHLFNLQYLDVSNNCLEHLDGLANLVHLRELVANDNEITHINGILQLDGLLKLQLRGNRIQVVDFERCQLRELTTVDLSYNQLITLKHLENLPSVSRLSVDGNNLKHGLHVTKTMLKLTHLSMESCNLESLDVAHFPGLTELHLDNNCLATVGQLPQLKALNILSMRRQTLPQGSSVSVFDEGMEASSVFLSGTLLRSLTLSTSFLNMRYLELASAGLQCLPDDFGVQMPNLRTLNLNSNSLRDIRPLLNIYRLETLTVCGNRIDRLRKTIAALAKLASLQSLDLRDNPLTQGFYPGVISNTMSHTSLIRTKACRHQRNFAGTATTAADGSQYELPKIRQQEDVTYRSRLDEGTELRRRVYEILLANSCQRLHFLDGMRFDRLNTGAKDRTWERLVDLGIVRKSRNVTEMIEL